MVLLLQSDKRSGPLRLVRAVGDSCRERGAESSPDESGIHNLAGAAAVFTDTGTEVFLVPTCVA